MTIILILALTVYLSGVLFWFAVIKRQFRFEGRRIDVLTFIFLFAWPLALYQNYRDRK